jgi:hypothetical protein
VLDRAGTDPVVAKTKVEQLVKAFLWNAEVGEIVTVLIRAGIVPGRRVGAWPGGNISLARKLRSGSCTDPRHRPVGHDAAGRSRQAGSGEQDELPGGDA